MVYIGASRLWIERSLRLMAKVMIKAIEMRGEMSTTMVANAIIMS